MGPPEHPYGDGDAELCRPKEFAPVQLLSTIKNRLEGNDRCGGFELLEGLPESDPQSAVAMPNREEMVTDQADAGDQHETAADPERMGDAPEDLPDGLGMAGDADDASGIEPDLGFQDRRDLQQVVGLSLIHI